MLAVAPLPLWLLAALIVLALLLGGGTRPGLGSDAVIQLLSLGVIAFALARGQSQTDFQTKVAYALIAAAVALPFLQLIPLPPSIWTALPGRSLMVDVYRRANEDLPWLAVSLDARATLASALSLLPAIAVFLLTVQLDWRARRTMTLLILAVGVVSVLLGLAQIMQGQDSALRFYPFTNQVDSVGFFANRNHYAALLYCLIPFAIGWTVGLIGDRRPERSFGLLIAVLVYVLLVLGIAMARSRAGLFLGVLTTLGSLLMVRAVAGRLSRRSLLFVGATIVLALLVGGRFGFYGLLARFNDGVLDTFRDSMGATTIAAARVFLPFGSGFGTFVPVYQIFETPDVALTAYVNHAHSDWLESLLEGGWAALAIAALFIVWFLLAGGRAWEGRNQSPLDNALACAATLAIAGLLLHSATDYPLRTTAMTVVFAFSSALLVQPVKARPRVAVEGGGRPGAQWLRSVRNFRDRRRMRGWRGGGFG